jgi:hypothetical protein
MAAAAFQHGQARPVRAAEQHLLDRAALFGGNDAGIPFEIRLAGFDGHRVPGKYITVSDFWQSADKLLALDRSVW